MERLLPNQTWVCSPDAEQGQTTDARLWWRKAQCLLQAAPCGAKQREEAPHAQKTLTPGWVRAFKGKAGERVAGAWPRGAQLSDGFMWRWPGGARGISVNRLVSTCLSMQLTSSSFWGFSICKTTEGHGSASYLYSTEEELKFLLCFMTKLILFCLSWLFSFVSVFSILWLHLIFGIQGRPSRTSFSIIKHSRHWEKDWVRNLS